MLATGGSAVLAISVLKEAGADERKIVFIAILASQEGLRSFQQHCPLVRTYIVQVDPTLNDKKMIVPGLGDFGDRYFAT
jgi:uracil phosphoribosyltransferase